MLAAGAAGSVTSLTGVTGVAADSSASPPTIFSRGDPTQPFVYLTYDDGYNTQIALDIAATADAFSVQVTFLPVSSTVEAHAAAWQDIAARGHGFCNHTITHPYLTRLSYRQKEREILGAKESLERVLQLSYPVTILRPPFGKYDADVVTICQANGLRIVTGTVDSLGYTQGQDGSARATNVAINSASRGLITGGIVVMHVLPSDRNATAPLLQAAQQAGLQPSSLSGENSQLSSVARARSLFRYLAPRLHLPVV